MDAPTLNPARPVATETYEIAAQLPVPGLGSLAVNSYLIRGTEPTLVDTGLGASRADYLAALGGLLDLTDLRWIWVTHADPDHIGNLAAVLEAAPRARLVTGFLGLGKLALHGLPTDRVHRLEAGERLELGDRELVALRPPYYDAPETCGLLDTRTRALFSADAFGAVLPEPAERADAVPAARLREGMATWAGIDAPWLGEVTADALRRRLAAVAELRPEVILSAHLPAAPAMTDSLLDHLANAARATAPTAAADTPVAV